jgi:Outer membrane protein Omp28
MKNNFLKLVFIFAAIFTFGCDEKPIEIPPVGQGVTSQRKVLIEEFTGVSCPNCPQGAAEIANLKGIYGENLIAVSIHAGEFTDPIPNKTKQDFRTEEGTSLEIFLGTPLGYPAAVVDRRQFPGASALQAFKAQWAGFIQQELAIEPSVSLNLIPKYNALTRQLFVDLTILPNKNLSGDYRVSLMITENHIKDAQINGINLVEDYEHEHVLRDMLTPFDGAAITETLAFGVPISRNYSFTLPTNWVAENCHIVAFVHRGGAPDKVVIQAEEKPIL